MTRWRQPGDGGNDHPVTPPTAQHAQRRGRAAARNIAASLGIGQPRPYRHDDLGLVADLGGTRAVATVLGIPLAGPAAKAAARGYHLYALPSAAAKVRVAADWFFASTLPTRVVQLNDVRPGDAPIATAQATGIYASSNQGNDDHDGTASS